jgi:Zn-dependent protease with chaperone function
MKIIAAYYLLISCVFLVGYAIYVLVSQWADVEPGDIALLMVFWFMPCIAGIYVVVANRLVARRRTGSPDTDA